MPAQQFSPQFVASIDANRTIKDELADALARQRQRRRISVTDLINLRLAFFRRTRPDIQTSADRLRLMLAGSGFHDLFGMATAGEEYVEQFVEYEGVVGKIDIYRAVPLELKMTGSIPENVLASRPSYLDQLGLYCAITGKAAGRLVLHRRATFGREPLLLAYRVEYLALGDIVQEMIRRRDLLEAALATCDPSRLPQCEWIEHGCEYLACCGCEDAPVSPRIVPPEAVRVTEAPDVAAFLMKLLQRPRPPAQGFSLNDLVFPRKAALARASCGEDEPEQDGMAALAQLEREGLKTALFHAMRFGQPGAFSRMPVALRSLQGFVSCYKGVPTLLRTTKFTSMVPRNRLGESITHYFDRLAFECALAGHERGRLILYYEALPGSKFMVYDVWFREVAAIYAEANRRLGLLESNAPATELPACPVWMAKFCQFAPACGCGSAQQPKDLLPGAARAA